MKIIPYSKQDITAEDLKAVSDCLQGELLTQGPSVEAFEKEFAKHVQAPHAVAVTNGTGALHLAAMSLGVKPGDKVLCAPLTFVASANCMRYCGAEVEFVDIDPETYCIDLKKLEEKLKSQKPGTYKGVVVIDYAGYAMDLEKLAKLVKPYGMWILEDACHAPGAKFQNSEGRWISSGSGEYVDCSVFSFHPVKHIATGEGGAITTKDPARDKELRILRTHGIVRDPAQLRKNDGPWYMEMQELGYNYRIPDLNCALGRSQLRRQEQGLARRQVLVQRYRKELAGLPMTLPKVPSTVFHAYHLFVIQIEERKKLYTYLREQGIYSQVHYLPVHQHPYYVDRYGVQSFPVADKFYERCLSIPLFPSMTDEEQTRVIAAIKEFF